MIAAAKSAADSRIGNLIRMVPPQRLDLHSEFALF
jgi:hypothetical protein